MNFLIFCNTIKYHFCIPFNLIQFISDQHKAEPVKFQIISFILSCADKEWQDIFYSTLIIYFYDIYEESVANIYFVASSNVI